MIEGFLLFCDYAETIRTMTDSAAGILIKMIFNHVTGEDVNAGIEDQAGADYDSAKIAFGFIRRQVDRSIESYEELKARRREAATKGAEARWKDHSKGKQADAVGMPSDAEALRTDAEGMRTDGKQCLLTPTLTPTPTLKDKKRGRFTPPTLEEVKAYCEERKSSVDPVRFFEYFQTGGWKDSKGNPVRSWKQKLITWEKHSETPKKQNQFLQFEQHEYDFDALEKELLQN